MEEEQKNIEIVALKMNLERLFNRVVEMEKRQIKLGEDGHSMEQVLAYIVRVERELKQDLKFELDNIKWRLAVIESYINKDGGVK